MIAFQITGMNCQHCVRAAIHALEAVPGVPRIEIDLASGLAEVQRDADRAALIAAVQAAGYAAAPAGTD